MDLNPYESPKEQGYESPEEAKQRAERRDTLYLFLTAIGIFVLWMASFYLNKRSRRSVDPK